MSAGDLDRRVADHGAAFVDEWRDACRIPSVSGDLEASGRMADWIEERLVGLFDETRRIEVAGYGPALVATLAGHSPRRLLLYSHYDVQPAGDPTAWEAPPFAAEVVDGAVVARGTCDDKADVTARLQALRLWRETWRDGRPPYTLVWLCEGAEEVGSPGLDDLLRQNRDDLAADWCLWESFIRAADGRPEVAFGCRGSVAFELSVQTMAHDQHSAFSPVFRSAAIELAHALASLVDTHGTVLVDGFEEGIVPFDEVERAAGRSVRPPGAEEGVDELGPHLQGLDPERLAERLLYTPTLNVSAMASGDVDAGAGVVTSTARANVDLHLVPDQDPDAAAAAVRRHLDARGFGHVRMRIRGSRRPAKSPVDTPLGRAAIAAAAETMGEPVVYPLLPGSGPARSVLDILGATTVSPAGTTRLASGIHAVNERGRIDDYLDHVRFSYRLLERLAAELAQSEES